MTISPPSAQKLHTFLQRTYPGCQIQCAYEAGYCGFWVHDQLKELGMNTLVVHPSDVPTTDKERRFKEDVRDSRKLALALRAGLLKSIYVPPRQQRMDRSLVRQRYRTHGNTQRTQLRIRGHLTFHGVALDDMKAKRGWTNARITMLEDLAERTGDGALSMMLSTLRQQQGMDREALKQLGHLCREERYAQRVQLLRSIPGVGLLTAIVFLVEIGDVSRFDWDQLHAYCGLIPGSRSSGETEVRSRLTKRGNTYLRTALVLSSWMAIRLDMTMLKTYEQLCKRMKGQKAIIRIAKKQANRMRSVLVNQKRYTPQNIELCD